MIKTIAGKDSIQFRHREVKISLFQQPIPKLRIGLFYLFLGGLLSLPGPDGLGFFEGQLGCGCFLESLIIYISILLMKNIRNLSPE